MQLLSLIYEPAPNEKQIYSIVSHFRETRGSSDHVGQLQNVERKKSKKNKKSPFGPQSSHFRRNFSPLLLLFVSV